MHLDIATLTDKGRLRDVNEDSLYAQVLNVSETEPIGLLVVCDGMGGHLGGECASHWAIETLKKELGDLFCSRDSRATLKLSEAELEAVISGHQVTRKLDISGIGTEITEAVEKANQVVMEYARQKPSEAGDAGTTLTMAVVKNGAAMIANVGDSRTFILRDGVLRQITNDHSLVWGLFMKQQISEEEIYTHPSRSVIYRSLGQKEKVTVDLFQEELMDGDILLLCSDGLWEMVRDRKWMIEAILSAENLTAACTRLVEAANQAGGDDNISVILARYHA